MAPEQQTLLDAEAVARSVRRVASEIAEEATVSKRLALVGIRKGGAPLAAWLAREIERSEGMQVAVGAIDIAFYRDDAASMLPDPEVGPSEIDFDVRGMDVVLVDDVLHTGRTVRAAIDCLLDFGRPRRIWLAVLVDRGDRELPVAADFVGRTVEVSDAMTVDVVARGEGDDRVVARPILTAEDQA